MTPNGLNRASLTQVYLPADRRHSLAHNLALPEYCRGSALFTDISGFTLLTEALKHSLGPRQGAEQLAQHLNQVYDALIAEVDRYGGSVIGFSGDAITCWFDETFISQVYRQQDLPLPPADSCSAALRAVTCALAMLATMQQFAAIQAPGQGVFPLKVKVAVASGAVHRWVVGDPQYQSIEVTAGETMQRMADAEGLAGRGEVVVDQATASLLSDNLIIGEQRQVPDRRECYFLAQGLHIPAAPLPWPDLAAAMLPEQPVASYLLPPIYDRLTQGQGEFLTELRPAVALFLRFGSIEYESDPQAGSRLDAYIRWVQQVVRRYDGTFIQLTIGEKGSYLYIAFGAPRAHEDDPWRAVHTALELRQPPAELSYIDRLQMGIASGVMRTGAYGGKTRRTYGVLGDEVNLSARLMQLARPDGQILITGLVQEALGEIAICRSLAPLQVKGKTHPTPVADLVGVASWRPILVTYQGPFIGRQAALEQLLQAVVPILVTPGRSGGLVVLDGEAGIGKSRLAHELHLHLEKTAANRSQPHLRWLECPTDPVLDQSLYPFRHLLHRYFAQDASLSAEENRWRFEAALDQLVQTLEGSPETTGEDAAQELGRQLQRTRSMLGALIGLHWPGSLYELLEPKQRFENTLAGLRALLLAESLRQPLILHIEDAHRLDADSLAMLKLLAHSAAAYPCLVLLSGRYCDREVPDCLPPQPGEFTSSLYLSITELAPHEIGQAAAEVLNRSAASASPVSPALHAYLQEKTSGNPLFLEELILELSERDLLQLEKQGWSLKEQRVQEAPAGLTALLISRLDRLENSIKTGVQTAAVIGREFEAPVLQRMLPPGEQPIGQVIEKAQAQQIWLPSGPARYSFRQSLLCDAAYTMQPQKHLKQLHTRAAEAIRQVHSGALEAHYADLAYHYHQAQDDRQALHYARLGGEAATAQYANQQAAHLLELALECAARLPEAETQTERLLAQLSLGKTLVLTGQHQSAARYLQQAVELAAQTSEADKQAQACRWLARLHENRGEYPQALEWIERGLQALAERETAETSELLNNAGLILSRQGNYPAAQEKAQRCLEIAEQSGDTVARARADNLLGHIARLRSDSSTAIEHFATALHLYQEAGDINGQALVQNQLANALFGLGRWQEAREHFTQARATFDQIGNIYHRSFVDSNLGWIALNQGRLEQALGYYQGGLAGLEQIGGSPYVLGAFHNNLGAAYIRQGDLEAARRHLAASQALFEQAGARDWLAELHRHTATAALLAGDLDEADDQAKTALALARELNMRAEEGNALRVLGEIATARGQTAAARQLLVQSLEILRAVGEAFESARSVLALARLNPEDTPKMAQELSQVIPTLERLGASIELAEARARLAQLTTA